MSEGDGTNFAVFRDCISVAVIREAGGIPDHGGRKQRASTRCKVSNIAQTNSSGLGKHVPEGSVAELADFVDYIAEEAFPILPTELKTLSFQALQEDEKLAVLYATPLSSNVVEVVANLLPHSIEDSLVSYRMIHPPSSDILTFFAPVMNNYISAVTMRPPNPATTRARACEMCERDWITLTYHHLIPRSVHSKVLKRGWHPEHSLSNVAWICRACHSFVHRMASNEELARQYFTVELILKRDDVQRFAAWVGGIRWKKK